MKYDFKDGNGPVAAHQHHNGGGWVADTATVEATAFVGPDALVFGNAQVSGNASVHVTASVHGNAHVSGTAIVSGNAQVFGDARVFGNAQVYGNAWVYGTAWVYGAAQVYGTAYVSEYARVYGDALVYGSAQVSGNAQVFGDAWVYGYARVFGDARVFGNALVFGNAQVSDYSGVRYSKLESDITNNQNIIDSVRCQTGLLFVNGELTCYKHVRLDLSSIHDPEFKYEVGRHANVLDPDLTTKSCASGLHVSNAQYWEGQSGKVVIQCLVSIEDIITVQEGKIRCKELFVVGICDGPVF